MIDDFNAYRKYIVQKNCKYMNTNIYIPKESDILYLKNGKDERDV